MKVTVKLFANLQELLPPEAKANTIVGELAPGATVGEVLREFKVPDDLKLIILVNSVHAGKDQVLKAGDVLAVFPPIAGG
jgi:sulfur-carrier protein